MDNIAQPPLAKHDPTILDLAFAMDCTGSMGSYIETAQANIRNIVEEIVAAEKSDIHLALVEYRDHPPQDKTFITKTHDFTASVKTMKGWLDGCSAQGGGDTPEAVADALKDVLDLTWREEATKICVFISDAPPHGLQQSEFDSFPNGCPQGIDPMDVVRDMAQHGITLYTVGCEPSITPFKEFFAAIAYMTGGQYVPLSGSKALTQVIVGGAQEEISLERWMADVHIEVNRAIEEAESGDINMEAVTRNVWTTLRGKGARGKQLKRNSTTLSGASSQAKTWAAYGKLSDIKAEFTSKQPELKTMFGRGRGRGGSRGSGRGSRSRSRSRSPSTKVSEKYSVEDDVIQIGQAERMVQKAMMRKKGGFKEPVPKTTFGREVAKESEPETMFGRGGSRGSGHTRYRTRERRRRRGSHSRSRSRSPSTKTPKKNTVEDGVIQIGQTERMVHKSNKKKKSGSKETRKGK